MCYTLCYIAVKIKMMKNYGCKMIIFNPVNHAWNLSSVGEGA